MRGLAFVVFFGAFARDGRADDGIPPETLALLKDATAMVKVVWQGQGQRPASGSAFVLSRDKETALFVTNAHVLTPLVPTWKMVGKPSLVLFSGTRRERVVEAEVLSIDTDRDLAVLKVSGEKDLPAEIPLPEKLEARETMTIYIVGFPLGPTLTLNEKHPAVTVSTGKVSSLRENERGEVALVQIDGNVNPGNSGGPVVDSKGRLVGVAVAKVKGTELGLAIAAGELSNTLLGRVSKVSIERNKVAEDEVQLVATATLLDPLGKVREVWGHYRWSTASKNGAQRDARGRWMLLPDAAKIDMKLEAGKATGEIRAPRPKGDEELLFQTAFVDGSGETRFLEPAKIQIRSVVAPTTPSTEDVALRPVLGKVTARDVTAAFRPQFESLVVPQQPKVLVELLALTGVSRLHCAAGGDALLLEEGPLNVPRRLLLFNLSDQTVTQAFRVPDPKAIFTCGQSQLFLFLPERGLLQRWSLATGMLEQEINWPEDWKPMALAQGAASDGPVLVYGEDGKNGYGRWVDSKNLDSVKARATFPRMIGGRTEMRPAICAAARAPVFVVAGSAFGVFEVFVCKLRPEGGVDVSESRQPFPLPVVPDADAQFFYCRGGGVYSSAGKLFDGPSARGAAAGPGYAHFDRHSWSFRPSGLRFEAAKLRISPDAWDYVWLSNRNQLACLVDEKLHVITVDLRAALAKAEELAKPRPIADVLPSKILAGEPTGLTAVAADGQELGLRTQEFEFPWTHERLITAGGGRYLLFQDYDHPRAILFDPQKRRAIGEFDIGEQYARLCASKSRLFAWLPVARRLKSWNLETQKLEQDLALPNAAVLGIATASKIDGPLLVVSGAADSKCLIQLVDPAKLDNALAEHQAVTPADGRSAVWVSPDGANLIVHLQQQNNFRWKDDKLEGPTVGRLGHDPSAPARRFTTPGVSLFAQGSEAFLRVESTANSRDDALAPYPISFYHPADDLPRGTLNGLALRLSQYSEAPKPRPLAERLFWFPHANLLVLVHDGKKANVARFITLDSQPILGPDAK